jgi:hypothetical protein
VIQVTDPLNLRKSGVVRTTSPVAPSLRIKTFIGFIPPSDPDPDPDR